MNMPAFAAHVVPPSSRAKDFGVGVRRYIVHGTGGCGLTKLYIAATSDADAELCYRKLHNIAPGDYLEHLLVFVHELED
jgi:hypothetical protein